MRRDRDSRWVVSALGVLAAVVGLVLVTVARGPWHGATAAISVALAVLLAREIVLRLNVSRALTRATRALKDLGYEVDQNERSVPEVLDGLAQRVCELLRAEWCAVSLTDDTGALRLESTAGQSPLAVGDERDGGAIPRGGTRGQMAAPLAIGDNQLGVLEVGAAPGRRFTRTDHEFLHIFADHMSTTIERARLVDAERRSRMGSSHARAHLALLAEVSVVLARALDDPEPALAESARIIAQSIGDACVIHLARADGTLERAAVVDVPLLDVDTSSGLPYDEFVRRFPTASDALRRVMETGRSELSFIGRDGHLQGVSDAMSDMLRAAGMTSWVVAPIRVRGLAVGTILVATGPNRRGLRASDRSTIDEVANRMAIVIERAQLYQDSRRAAVAAEQRAAQLSRLVEATIAFNRSLQTQDLLDALVVQTGRVLDASYSRAWLSSDSGLEAEYGTHSRGFARLGSSLVDAGGGAIGYLSVEREESRSFTDDEEALLLLLARLASVALQNARLYDTLRTREERMSALFAASPLAIVELDLSGTVRDINPAGRALFGATGTVSLPPALEDRVTELVGNAIRHGVTDIEVSVPIGDEQLDLWVSAAPLHRPRGAPAGALMVIRDTTARKRLEEQLIEAHRYEAIAQLAGGVAHDFNNLLTIIVGYSDLALRAGDVADVREELTAINEAGQLAAVITNQLLLLSRRQILKPVTVSLAEACASIVPMLRRLVGERVAIESMFTADAAITIDQGQLEQILFNLVLNSRDAMASEGTITIRSAHLDDGSRVALMVSDTGAGMDAETLARCREPFFTTKGRRGIGLGLATVVGIVERAGGRLDIESELGKGTTISAVFPVAVDARVVEGELPPHRAARVVVVDDDEVIRRWVGQILADAGYQVVSHASAEDALAWIHTDGSFDLLVSDVVLPGISGFELAREVEQQCPTVAKLLMTGFAGTDTAGTDLGLHEILSKPFSIDEFLKAVGRALDTRPDVSPVAPADQGSKR